MLIETPQAAPEITASSSLREKSLRIASLIEAKANLILIAFAALFLLRYAVFSFRKLWYDEIITLDIVRLHSFRAMWNALTDGLDLNPPLSHLVTKGFATVFGYSELVLRAPETLGFLGCCLAAYAFVSRRSGKLLGITAAMLLSLCLGDKVAAQARPYGLALGSAAFALVQWQAAVSVKRRRSHLAMLSASLIAALLSHCYAILFFVPLAGAEFVRLMQRRKADWPLWSAIAVSFPVVLLYLPLEASTHQFIHGKVAWVNWESIPRTYSYALEGAAGPLSLIALISLGVIAFLPSKPSGRDDDRGVLPLADAVCLVLCAAIGIAGILLSYVANTPWSTRYGYGSAFGVCCLFMVLVKRCQFSDRWAEILALVIAAAAFLTAGFQPRYQFQAILGNRAASALPVSGLDSSKPVVISNGLILEEANLYEPESVVRNLYYLVDREASLHYTEHVVFEQHFKLVEKYNPLRAKLAQYRQFTSDHKSFYVYGPWEYGEDWLLKKLNDDGAAIRVVRRAWIPANPETDVMIKDAYWFEVTMP